jgi:uncharacterized protein CbrC (UPF0167 family)
MTAQLPTFRYHPDPVATGSLLPSAKECESCGQARGYEYTATPHCEEDVEVVCSWCIADGTAAKKFDAEFTDRAGIGGYGDWDSVPDEVAAVVAERTPGFSGWQQERWWTHCGDAAAYVGPAGKQELLDHGPQAVQAIKTETGYEGDEWDFYLNALDKDAGPTAYVFRCLHCDELGGYSDCH